MPGLAVYFSVSAMGTRSRAERNGIGAMHPLFENSVVNGGSKVSDTASQIGQINEL
jgi:hypothetical protein